MKKLIICLLAVLLFSCDKTLQTVTTANLSEFESGQITIYKPSDSNLLRFNGVIETDTAKYFVSESVNKYELFDLQTGQRSFSFQIPREGPEAMRGTMNGAAIINTGEYAVFNQTGQFHSYVNGKLTQAIQINLSEITKDKFTQISKETGNIIKTGSSNYQVVLNPFDLMNANGGFDTEFGAWVFQIDLEKGISCISEFRSPFDESFHDSPSATLSMGTKNTDRDEYWYMFALSDSVYQIKDCKIVEKHRLEAIENKTYYPDLVTRNGRSAQWNPNPKNHINVKLLYDNKTSSYLRVVQLPKDISEEKLKAMDVRKSSNKEADYQIMIYDLRWGLKAKLNFTVPEGNNMESCFVHEGIFYLNQPDQVNEDEYMLVKYDLTSL